MDFSRTARSTLIIAALAACLAACMSSGTKREATRIDASSDATAEASFKAMLSELPNGKQQELLVAMIEINLEGVQSAYDIVGNPQLQRMSITRIKDRVAGMTAEEIVAYAETVSTVEAQLERR